MTNRFILIPFLFLLCFCNAYAQDDIPTSGSIELNNGEIIIGTAYDVQIVTSDKIKFCNKQGKDCQKYPITEINKITKIGTKAALKRYNKTKEKYPNAIPMNSGVVKYFKALYFPSDKNDPKLAKLEFKGENFELYSQELNLPRAKIRHVRMYITKANSSDIVFSYRYHTDKKMMKSLANYFHDCSAFKNEVEKKNAHKNSMRFFYELADSCKK
ncbi:MAG: hypothetical protein ABJI22_00690 [Maribacter sp.]